MEKDAALNRFKSSTQSVKQIKKVGNVLKIIVVAGMLLFSKSNLRCIEFPWFSFRVFLYLGGILFRGVGEEADVIDNLKKVQ